MIPLQVQIIAYDKQSNDCTGKLLNGNIISIDPFVGCAIKMTDEEYENNKGAELVGCIFILHSYSVYPTHVVPHENGMLQVDF
jgi:hypothetical protein